MHAMKYEPVQPSAELKAAAVPSRATVCDSLPVNTHQLPFPGMLAARFAFRRVPALQPMRCRLSTTAAVDEAHNTVLCNVDTDGFATVTLNRPEVFNAFSDVVISRLSEVFKALKKQNGACRRRGGRPLLPLTHVACVATMALLNTRLDDR